jgi:hypothetical protein
MSDKSAAQAITMPFNIWRDFCLSIAPVRAIAQGDFTQSSMTLRGQESAASQRDE